jgi:hypothetical protein
MRIKATPNTQRRTLTSYGTALPFVASKTTEMQHARFAIKSDFG